MAQRYSSCVPLPSHPAVEGVVEQAIDWALMHGAAMRPKTNSHNGDVLTYIPFTLVPSTLPKSDFNAALQIQTSLNELVHAVAHDDEFLSSTLKNSIQADPFTKQLFDIYKTVKQEGFTQKLSLGLLRSDYLMSQESKSLKQVEINTIASSFAALSTHVGSLHRYVLGELGYSNIASQLPENTALAGLCGGLIDAWKLFNNPNSVIMFLVEELTYNICDQRFMEYQIRISAPHIKVIRKTFTQLSTEGELDSNKNLIVDGQMVAVIYFRVGYSPDHFVNTSNWDLLLMMERSTAIKCPSVQYHLAGTKKVQQELAKPGVLERFLTDHRKVEAVRNMFTGIYSLDQDEEGNKAAQLGIDNPEKFVLKPQREGGGNNIYGDAIRAALLNMKGSERSAYILMEKIVPPVQQNILVRNGCDLKPIDIVSELGIFGVIIGDENGVIINRCAGHMLRTKGSTTDEGGVAAGFAALDSPYLLP